ncbi:GATA zinc finger domain-containing protein 4-like [Bombyx mandarina]|uniref:GATA zinc finger domain-containing protein 4-like n=1 Tax=Bombyx mandarina TaxID=7092 RepID=A0A6J2KHQ6_BOMMA|nr:GATA zinc finger domain-containing protein 4-like [Bombyx mandarina]
MYLKCMIILIKLFFVQSIAAQCLQFGECDCQRISNRQHSNDILMLTNTVEDGRRVVHDNNNHIKINFPEYLLRRLITKINSMANDSGNIKTIGSDIAVINEPYINSYRDAIEPSDMSSLSRFVKQTEVTDKGIPKVTQNQYDNERLILNSLRENNYNNVNNGNNRVSNENIQASFLNAIPEYSKLFITNYELNGKPNVNQQILGPNNHNNDPLNYVPSVNTPFVNYVENSNRVPTEFQRNYNDLTGKLIIDASAGNKPVYDVPATGMAVANEAVIMNSKNLTPMLGNFKYQPLNFDDTFNNAHNSPRYIKDISNMNVNFIPNIFLETADESSIFDESSLMNTPHINTLNLGKYGSLPIINGLPVAGITETVTLLNAL